jgi:hypothetical protein
VTRPIQTTGDLRDDGTGLDGVHRGPSVPDASSASGNAAARRFGVSIASAVRWVTRYKTTGNFSPSPSGGDRQSGRIEAQRDYLLGLIRLTADTTLLEIQERPIQNCGERFCAVALLRPPRRHF